MYQPFSRRRYYKRSKVKKNVLPSIFESKSINDNEAEDEDFCARIGDVDVNDTDNVNNVNNVNNSNNDNDNNDNIGHIRNCTVCDDLKIENCMLREDFLNLQRDTNILVAKLENEIKKLRSNNNIQKDHIKYLDQKLLRIEKARHSLQNVLEELKDQQVLSKEVLEILEVSIMSIHKINSTTLPTLLQFNYNLFSILFIFFYFQKIDQNEVLRCIVYGRNKNELFSEEVRQFAFALHYHSASAYNVVRSHFKNLPYPDTLKRWLQNSDISGEPGFHECTMQRLQKFVKDLGGKPLLCALIFDEIYIRKQVYYDAGKRAYGGYITYGKELEQEEANPDSGQTNELRRSKRVINTQDTGKSMKNPIASRAIIFMLSSINMKFKMPFGYLVNGLGGEYLSKLVTEVIIKSSKCGVKITNLTFDGAKASPCSI